MSILRQGALACPSWRELPTVARAEGFPSSLALTTGSALLVAASLPPLGIHALGWVALAPLLVAVVRLSPARAAVCGLAFGLVLCAATAWWFTGMLARYFEIPTWAAIPGFAVTATALVGVHVALFAAWLAWLARHRPVGPLVVAAGWGASELARMKLSAGIPWGHLAYSQAPGGVVVQIADLVGPYGIGMMLAATSASVAGLIEPRLRARRPRLALAAVALACAATIGYGRTRLAQSFAEGEAVRVAIVQAGIGPSIRPPSASPGDLLARYLELTEQAAQARPRVVFWPEFAVDLVPYAVSEESRRLLAASLQAGSELVVGAPFVGPGERSRVRHNSTYLLRAGRIAGRYDKESPLPLAERAVFAFRAARALEGYDPGQETKPLDSLVGPIGVVLCSEAMDPAFVRRRVRDGAELLDNPSNDAWFGADSAARAQLAIASLRAVESRKFLVRATPTGYSAVIDPHGRAVAQSTPDAAEVLLATVFPRHGLTVYHRLGDVLPLAGAAVVAILSVRAVRGRRSGAQGVSYESL